MSIPRGKSFAPVGRCIYCDTTDGKLSREHIIPYALGGNLVLPYASCTRCADITKKFEQICARTILGNVRIRHEFPTRRPGKRPTTLEILCVRSDGTQEMIAIPPTDFPTVIQGPKFLPPGLLEGRPILDDEWPPIALHTKASKLEFDSFESKIQKIGMDRALIATMDFPAYLRMLAKIAHAFAISQVGVSAFRHELPPLILNASTSASRFLHHVGSDFVIPAPTHFLHRLEWTINTIRGRPYLTVVLRLFDFLDLPQTRIIVGEYFPDHVHPGKNVLST